MTHPDAISLAHLAARTFIKMGAGRLLVVGARHQAPLVIFAALDSMLVVDGARRHRLGALVRSGAPLLKSILREPQVYCEASVAFTIESDGTIDIEAQGGTFEGPREPDVARLSPDEVRALSVLMNAEVRDWPPGFPGVQNCSRRL